MQADGVGASPAARRGRAADVERRQTLSSAGDVRIVGGDGHAERAARARSRGRWRRSRPGRAACRRSRGRSAASRGHSPAATVARIGDRRRAAASWPPQITYSATDDVVGAGRREDLDAARRAGRRRRCCRGRRRGGRRPRAAARLEQRAAHLRPVAHDQAGTRATSSAQFVRPVRPARGRRGPS